MDSMSDALNYGDRFRSLNELGGYNRQALAIVADTSHKAERVISVLEPVISWCAKPQQTRVDNDPEFTSGAL
ncbi:hypothetical protein N476_21170 [Pseudoalteromonas luteoviolacea H33]|uniref:Integrase catalytic domain-containing protein n=2 Tax=Pseudoalteromonas luteoviolacea TaxID=43657 RepID=A0A167DEA3_9GAMM|nr:hypothetical protein N476_21170 [Pseudoalteromonas luteoviolacea H33]KZN75437.1 hypothetical protein N477_01615 [Pseudoalteromonas luteoviolacea H33-S]